MSTQGQRQQWVLYFAVLVLGGCGLAYEYTLSKLISDLLGNSVRQWAIIIAVMMFFMGIGSDAQKHVSDRRVPDFFVGGEILLALIGGFGPILLFQSYALIPSHYILVQYFIVGSIGFLIGIEIPLLSRLNEKHAPELGKNLGGVLKMDYLGALIGALIWVFVLPQFLSYVQMGFFLGIFNLLVAGFTLFWFRRELTFPKAMMVATFLGTASLSTGLFQVDKWAQSVEQYLYTDHIVWRETTPYQHLVLTESPVGNLALYINGHLQFHSFDEHIYHEMLVHPAMALVPQAQRILILGGGDGLAVREVLKYPQVQEIILCDLDPAMTRLASEQPYLRQLNRDALRHAKVKILENGALLPSGKEAVETPDKHNLVRPEYHEVAQVQIINLDAYKFVEQFQGNFDVIIADFPDPNSPDLSKLYSHGFYQMLLARLSPQGVLIQQSTSPALARAAFLCVGKTMRSAGFEAVALQQNVPSFGQWGWWVARRPGIDSTSLLGSLQQLPEWSIPLQYVNPEIVRGATYFGKGMLDDRAIEVNHLIRPHIFNYYLQGWIL